MNCGLEDSSSDVVACITTLAPESTADTHGRAVNQATAAPSAISGQTTPNPACGYNSNDGEDW